MKIGIYGGAFNPVHNEHVNIVLAAKAQLGLDKVVVVPTFISPHKGGNITASAGRRLDMCRLAFKDVGEVEVSDCEIKRGGVSYSYVTCRRFKKQYAEDELYFIMGADMLETFHMWKEPVEILKCATPAVCAREDSEALKKYILAFQKRFKSDLVAINYVGKPVSSTRVRVLAALGEDVSEFVPESVRNFIRSKKIYLREDLTGVKKYLTLPRWQHTVRVAVAAAEHRPKAFVTEYEAVTAAALHDCAKYLGREAEELKGFIFPENVPQPVLHQYSGAYVAEHIFGIKDENILNAVRYHASGRENMSPLEKLVYLADLLEEGRDFDGVERLRTLFDKDLDGCLLAAFEHQIKYLNSTGAPVYPLTARAYKYLKENYDK